MIDIFELGKVMRSATMSKAQHPIQVCLRGNRQRQLLIPLAKDLMADCKH
jgi:hypothetical protein